RARMNAGQTADEIVNAVEPDPELATRPYLRATYDHPKFIVRNLLRLWGGGWNGNAADLLPSTSASQAAEIGDLAGAAERLGAEGGGGRAGGGGRCAARVAPRGGGDARGARGPGGAGAQARRLCPPARGGRGADGARHLPRGDAGRADRPGRGGHSQHRPRYGVRGQRPGLSSVSVAGPPRRAPPAAARPAPPSPC